MTKFAPKLVDAVDPLVRAAGLDVLRVLEVLDELGSSGCLLVMYQSVSQVQPVASWLQSRQG